MNLVTEPWIPVVKPDGTHQLLSLLEIFTRGREFSDLAVRPHERIALMRLLICISQAALDGPADIKAWDKAPEILPEAAKKYLDKWQNSFDLFHTKQPFLQVAGLEKVEKKMNKDISDFNPVSKLNFALASQNNSTLLDHNATSQTPRIFKPEWSALYLLCFQNFSSSGRIGVAVWQGNESFGLGSSSASPCIHRLMLHTFIRMSNLFDTICANLITKQQSSMYLKPFSWGKPIWELPPKSLTDKEAIINTTDTYLGRLVPQSRLIQIQSSGDEMILANGFTYPGHPERPADATATEFVVKIKNKVERRLLKSDSKEIWRKLPAILSKYAVEKNGRSPLCLDNQTEKSIYDIWVGGIKWSSEGGYIDDTESVFSILPNLQTSNGVKCYENEVLFAETLAKRLAKAVSEYLKKINGYLGNIDQELNGKKKREKQEKLDAIVFSIAINHYWTAVEKIQPKLLEYATSLGNPTKSLLQTEVAAENIIEKQKLWRKALLKAAYDSYRLACGQETPRQIRAFALGWAKLVGKRNDQDTVQDADTENLENEEAEI